MTSLIKKHYNIKVYGHVQGVGFRYNTMKAAQELNIKGFVQNKQDRSVYIEAEGESKCLNTFLDWCKKGPDWAQVNKFNYSESNLQNFKTFEIR